jgi:hypothetical protein
MRRLTVRLPGLRGADVTDGAPVSRNQGRQPVEEGRNVTLLPFYGSNVTLLPFESTMDRQPAVPG